MASLIHRPSIDDDDEKCRERPLDLDKAANNAILILASAVRSKIGWLALIPDQSEPAGAREFGARGRADEAGETMTADGGRRVVVDNGSHYCKAGFSTDEDPTTSSRNLVIRPRSRADNQIYSLVGQVPPELLVGLDAARAPVKSPFESNIVVNFEAQETVFDYVFAKMGLGGDGALGHEVVLTECVLNPQASRQAMAELLFETYGCPGLHMGPDCTFAYAHNHLVDRKRVRANGIVVGMGHTATNVVPIVAGKPDFQRCLRMELSGMGLTSQLQRCLEIKYAKSLNRKDHPLSAFNLAEAIKTKICFVAKDYGGALGTVQRRAMAPAGPSPGGAEAEGFGPCECPELADLIPQLDLNTAVERIQLPEIYFQPSIAGVDQMSLTDTVETCAQTCAKGELLESVVLTGGSSKFPGMCGRLERELRERTAVDRSLGVTSGQDASLDAWRGAAAYANDKIAHGASYATFVDRKTYEEVGASRVFAYEL